MALEVVPTQRNLADSGCRPLMTVLGKAEEPQTQFLATFAISFSKGPKKEKWIKIAKEFEPSVSNGFYISCRSVVADSVARGSKPPASLS